MGMTIDKEDRYMNACIKYLKMNMRCVGYRDYIIERLNKYQKIQEIINNTDGIEEDVIRYKMICGVVEDGNDD